MGSDPTTRQVGQSKVTEFSVGVRERAYKNAAGERVEPATEWYDCVAWNALGDVIATYAKKGHKVYIEARRKTNVYTDKNGIERKSYDYIVRDVELLTPKEHRNDSVPADISTNAPTQDLYTENKDELPF